MDCSGESHRDLSNWPDGKPGIVRQVAASETTSRRQHRIDDRGDRGTRPRSGSCPSKVRGVQTGMSPELAEQVHLIVVEAVARDEAALDGHRVALADPDRLAGCRDRLTVGARERARVNATDPAFVDPVLPSSW
jgi:hypothetical protein